MEVVEKKVVVEEEDLRRTQLTACATACDTDTEALCSPVDAKFLL